MKKLLWVAPDFPFPPNHGGRFDVHRRLLEVADTGIDIHLVATVKADPAAADVVEARRIASRVDIVRRVRGLSALLRGCPHQVASRSPLASIALQPHYDLLIMESEYVAEILRNPGASFDKVALRVHNDEAVYYRNLAGSVPLSLRRFYYWYEMTAFARFSDHLKARVDASWYISSDEALRDTGRYEHAVHVPTPFCPAVTVDEAVTLRPADGTRQVLFIGSLFMVNNLEGLQWYIKQVHPHLFDVPGYSLVVAGNCSGVGEEILARLASVERLVLHRTPASLGPIYGQATVFINPMLHGSGVKMKTVNAIEHGLPVVSTSIGLEGLDLRDGADVLKADDPGAFAGHVRRLLVDPVRAVELARTAQSQCRRTASFLPHLRTVLESNR